MMFLVRNAKGVFQSLKVTVKSFNDAVSSHITDVDRLLGEVRWEGQFAFFTSAAYI